MSDLGMHFALGSYLNPMEVLGEVVWVVIHFGKNRANGGG
jgi:hypothetical protein